MIEQDDDIDATLARAGTQYRTLCPIERDPNHDEVLMLEQTIRAAVNSGTCPEVQLFVFESRSEQLAADACCLGTHLAMLTCYWAVRAEQARQRGQGTHAAFAAKSARFEYFRMAWAKAQHMLGERLREIARIALD